MEPLEEYYSGDDAWQRLVNIYKEDYLDDNARLLAKKINGNLDIAVVIYGKRGLREGIWWLNREVPALDYLKPIDCLQEDNLIKRLKECLMRMS
ncbi:hypothetical protein ACQYRI_09485 [Salmonella enterica]